MRLPENLYRAAKPVFAHHAPWHAARQPDHPERRGPGTMFPDVKALNEPGCGEQFLRFHREMIRVFKYLASTTSPPYAYESWAAFPSWLQAMFDKAQPDFLDRVASKITELVQSGSADDLGNFIEATGLSNDPYRNVHN